MALIPAFNLDDRFKELDDFEEEKISKALKIFQFVGEKFVNRARSLRTYRDITGNLRSSVGYLIAKFGKTEDSSFPGDKPKGKAKGKELAEEKVGKDGIILIGVAGMEYSEDVEARGKDVIAGSAKLAQKEVNDLLRLI